jgi:hypothetical protein
VRNPRGNPIKGTVCAVMMVVVLGYFAWIAISPLNLLAGYALGTNNLLPCEAMVLDDAQTSIRSCLRY